LELISCQFLPLGGIEGLEVFSTYKQQKPTKMPITQQLLKVKKKNWDSFGIFDVFGQKPPPNTSKSHLHSPEPSACGVPRKVGQVRTKGSMNCYCNLRPML
jgi:hypothetical protein